MSANLEKAAIRDEMRGRRASLEPSRRNAFVDAINQRLIDEITPSEIAVFASVRDEPSVLGAIRHWREHLDCTIYYPRIEDGHEMVFARVDDEDEMVEGKFGIPEPAAGAETEDIEEIGVALMPGLAFDKRGARVGYGGGYYDRALSRDFRYVPTLIGVCFDFQLIAEVPDEEHDVRVNWIITEERMLESSKTFRLPSVLR